MTQLEQKQLSQELQQLANYLSMELAIPLLQNPAHIQFATECVNAILGGLNPGWKKLSFSPNNQVELQLAWSKLMKIIESTLLSGGEKLLEDDEQIGLQNIVMLYEVLSQGCQVLRQQNLSPLINEKNENKDGQKAKQKDNQTKKENVNKNERNKNPEITKNKSKSKQKQSKQNREERPKTAKNAAVKRLEEEIIQKVGKTMQKKYLTKQQPRRNAKIREKQGTQAVQRAKRTLDYAVKQFQVSNRLNELKKQKSCNNNRKDGADSAYMKMIENRHKKLNNQISSQQLKYYLQLRDKKVAYIRHIHKLIQKLQRQRQSDFQKQQREVQMLKKKQILEKLESVNNIFERNMQELRQNYQKRKKVQERQKIGEMQVCRGMQREMRGKKAREMEEMKNLWEEERKQLERITGNEEKMKNRLIQIYRKYRI